jgi:succinoglycan biosynthesis transport protein ExoP
MTGAEASVRVDAGAQHGAASCRTHHFESRNRMVDARYDYLEEPVEKAPSIDVFAIIGSVMRRWKLIACLAVAGLVAAHVAARQMRPLYKSTVELLVYDPQRQIDAAVQKPISPFVNAIGYDAINTEVSIIKSKSVALRVASELQLDQDPEFHPRSRLAVIMQSLGVSRFIGAAGDAEATATTEAERLDQAADVLMSRMDASPNSYIISITAASQEPKKAQVLAQTIAGDYLASQREARQDALQRVAMWLKDRVDSLRARVLETEAEIQTFKVQNGIRDTEDNLVTRQQTSELISQLMAARERVDQLRARLEQAHRVIDSNGDIQSIPELAASPTLVGLRQRQADLRSRSEALARALGENHAQVAAARSELATVTRQISTEASLVVGTMQNAFDTAVRHASALDANLERLATRVTPDIAGQLQQLRRAADADRGLYESYLSQYNDINERRTLQDASARIISNATLPRSPTSTRAKLLYGLGGAGGLGAGVLFALLLEFRRRGFKKPAELENLFGRPVVGMIPLVSRKFPRQAPLLRWNGCRSYEAGRYAIDAARAMRINLELSNASPQVILVTSALPGEGKTTTARLLAASSAAAGRRTLLLDCDLHRSTGRGEVADGPALGLSDLLRRTAELSDVLVQDPVAKYFVISAGCNVSNAADWLMSSRMHDLIRILRDEFEYIVMDAPPLLPVVDALALSRLADKILIVVAWSDTPRRTISEAFTILRPEAHRVGGIVLNKIDFVCLPDYAYASDRYRPPSIAAS